MPSTGRVVEGLPWLNRAACRHIAEGSQREK
jgi:hypothetical protein